jgi:transposase
MVEDLDRQLEKERTKNSIPPIKITRGERRINHSQYAYDTLLLGRTSSIIDKIFKEILEEFMRDSRGNINPHKIHVYVWNTHSIMKTNIK